MTRDRGFSVIELLIAVAIVGILAAIAIPSYGAMMARSKQAEAKGNLSAIHSLEIAYHGEHQKFASFSRIGFVPDGENRYGYRIQASSVLEPENPPMGGGAGDDGEKDVLAIPPFGSATGAGFGNQDPGNPGAGFQASTLGNPHYDADSFEVVAIGRISAEMTDAGEMLLDAWTIDEHKTMVHIASGY